jgi:hypothetical protein
MAWIGSNEGCAIARPWAVLALLLGCSSDAGLDGDSGFSDTDSANATDANETRGTGQPGDDETSGGVGAGIPCDVADILAARCLECHADPPRFGASMPLVRHDDFLMPLPSAPGATVADGVASRLEDATRPMPPTGLLPPAERDVVQQWLAAGAPRNDGEVCDAPGGDDPPEVLPCEPSHEFRARGPGAADEPFEVPVVDDLYMCFTFRSPFGAQTQGTAWAPIVDDERVLHHWILYRTQTEQVDGGVGPCSMPSDATFLAGWAPGGGNLVMPDGVGLELAGPDEWLILQMHYNNTAGWQDAADRSGVALCTTDTPRAQTAGIVWLGTFDIDIPAGATGHQEVGNCPSAATSLLPGPLHVISSAPHMHELGRAFKTEILRGGSNAAAETLIDVPHFSFDNQQAYVHEPEVLVQPGDALRTTCTFDNPTNAAVGFGEGTGDEMCFNFALVYPVPPSEARVCTF